MQKLLADMQPKLIAAAEATARMIERITHDTVSIAKGASSFVVGEMLLKSSLVSTPRRSRVPFTGLPGVIESPRELHASRRPFLRMGTKSLTILDRRKQRRRGRRPRNRKL